MLREVGEAGKTGARPPRAGRRPDRHGARRAGCRGRGSRTCAETSCCSSSRSSATRSSACWREGFEPVIPPVLVRERALYGTGFLPDTEQQIYRLADDDLYLDRDLRGRARLAARRRDPRRPTRCRSATPGSRPASGARRARPARTRAGSSASTSSTRSRCSRSSSPRRPRPSTSGCWRSRSRSSRSSRFRTGWSRSRSAISAPRRRRSTTARRGCPGQERYRELTSCSNTTDYQARRLDIRYRPAERQAGPSVHTLNGTAVAVGRTIIALLENGQQDDGRSSCPRLCRVRGARAAGACPLST